MNELAIKISLEGNGFYEDIVVPGVDRESIPTFSSESFSIKVRDILDIMNSLYLSGETILSHKDSLESFYAKVLLPYAGQDFLKSFGEDTSIYISHISDDPIEKDISLSVERYGRKFFIRSCIPYCDIPESVFSSKRVNSEEKKEFFKQVILKYAQFLKEEGDYEGYLMLYDFGIIPGGKVKILKIQDVQSEDVHFLH